MGIINQRAIEPATDRPNASAVDVICDGEITAGDIVIASGLQDDVLIMRPARASIGALYDGTLWIAYTGNITGQVATVMPWGRIGGLNTAAAAVGDPVYLSSTVAGALTLTPPAIPIRVGEVMTVAANGYVLFGAWSGAAGGSSGSTTTINEENLGGVAKVLIQGDDIYQKLNPGNGGPGSTDVELPLPFFGGRFVVMNSSGIDNDNLSVRQAGPGAVVGTVERNDSLVFVADVVGGTWVLGGGAGLPYQDFGANLQVDTVTGSTGTSVEVGPSVACDVNLCAPTVAATGVANLGAAGTQEWANAYFAAGGTLDFDGGTTSITENTGSLEVLTTSFNPVAPASLGLPLLPWSSVFLTAGGLLDFGGGTALITENLGNFDLVTTALRPAIDGGVLLGDGTHQYSGMSLEAAAVLGWNGAATTIAENVGSLDVVATVLSLSNDLTVSNDLLVGNNGSVIGTFDATAIDVTGIDLNFSGGGNIGSLNPPGTIDCTGDITQTLVGSGGLIVDASGGGAGDASVTLKSSTATWVWVSDNASGEARLNRTGLGTQLSLDGAGVISAGSITPTSVLGFESEIKTLATADRTVNLPDGDGTVVFEDLAQTFTTKTMALGANTISGTLAQFNTACTDADFQETLIDVHELVFADSPHAALVAERLLTCDCTLGAITVTLPVLGAGVTGRWYHIKKIDASANAVTVAGGGANIDGAANQLINVQYNSLLVIAGATEWHIV